MSSGRRGLLTLIIANAVSNLGNVVAVVALPWFVLETTDSAARTGITAFATTVPLAAGAVISGPLVDRIGARRASILGDVGASAAIAGIPLAQTTGVLQFWLLLVLAFAAGLFEAPSRTARRAMLPDLANRAAMPLERANSISTTAEHVGYVLGAPLAGILITGLGSANALWLDAATFVLSAALVRLAVPVVRAAVGRTGLLDGLQFVVRTPLIRTFFIIWTVGGFLIAPLATVILPVYARRELGGAGDLSAAITAYGVGGLVGTALFALRALRLSRRRFFVSVWIAYPAMCFGLLAVPQLIGLLALLFTIGLVTGAYDPFEVTIHQELVPPDLRARAFAVLLAAEMSVVPLSMLLYGFLIEAAGLQAGLLLFAGGNAALAGYAISNRPARQLSGLQ